jgi:acyl dehydratase
MPLDYAALAVGDTISDRTFPIDTNAVEKYVGAVRDQSGVFDGADSEPIVPPMAVAAFALRGVLEDLGIPNGTLHTGQEMTFSGAVPVGDTLSCQAKVAQNSVRAGFRFIGVGMDVRDRSNRQVMSAKSMIMVPA